MPRPFLAVIPLALVALAACTGDAPGVVAPEASPASTGVRAPSASLAASTTGEVVPGQYIVVFRRGVAGGRQRAEQKAAGGTVVQTYSRVINGFSAKLGPLAVAALRADPDIELVAPDPVVSIGATQWSAPWGLDRIDQAALPLSSRYTYGLDGTGVTVYILDTGIRTTHVEFGGRAVAGYDAITPGGTGLDCHGHGTHVAGTVGGATYGVAKRVRLVPVRVLDCSGYGTGSSLLAGLDWVVAQKQASPGTPMVVNMSLSGGASTVFDQAVENVIAAGIPTVVAAGNAGADACGASPARVPAAITVGATDSGDRFAGFSNRGSCVDISAPGVSILSASSASNTYAVYMSGTSMAAPHVAGAAALYLDANPAATPAQVATALSAGAVVGRIVALPAATPNRLLNVAFVAPPAPPPPPPPPPAISVAPTSATVAVGASIAATATVSNPVAGATLTWTSSNPAVATVAQTGATTAAITGRGPGSAYVVATYAAGSTVVRDTLTISVPTPPAAPAAGLLVSAAGVGCLYGAAGPYGPGNLMRAAVVPCANGAVTQTWSVPPVGTSGSVEIDGDVCLVDTGGNYYPVGTALCNATSSRQRWTYTAAGELRAASGACVTAVPVSGGAYVQLRPCDGTPGQRWARQ